MIVRLKRSIAIFITTTLSFIPIFILFISDESKLLILKARGLGVIEIATAIAFAAAILFALVAAKYSSGWMRRHFILWFVLSLLFFGEETSWLQHYIKGNTPLRIRGLDQ